VLPVDTKLQAWYGPAFIPHGIKATLCMWQQDCCCAKVQIYLVEFGSDSMKLLYAKTEPRGHAHRNVRAPAFTQARWSKVNHEKHENGAARDTGTHDCTPIVALDGVSGRTDAHRKHHMSVNSTVDALMWLQLLTFLSTTQSLGESRIRERSVSPGIVQPIKKEQNIMMQ
jgi:hypothetical protein